MTSKIIMTTLAMIALIATIGVASIGNMNSNSMMVAFAARSSDSSDSSSSSDSNNNDQGSSDDQPSTSSSSSNNNDQPGSSSTDQQQGPSGSSSSSNDDNNKDLSPSQKHNLLLDRGYCPPGHHCACTSGVFHDYDATDRFSAAINNGCTSDKG